MSEQADWTRAYLLMAKDGSGNIIPLLVDASGQMYALLRGLDALGATQTVKVDADGQLYTVLRGASGVDVAVDASGFITAVLKGELAGVLTTIAVDDQGRLQAFVLDSESQWGSVLRVGNSELAGRLGSPVTYDWRGQVAYFADFSNGKGALTPTLVGTGASLTLVPTYTHYGGYSLALYGGSDATGFAHVVGGIGPSPTLRPGFAISFCQSGAPGKLGAGIVQESGGVRSAGEARLNFLTNTVQVYNGTTGQWESLGAFTPGIDTSVFHNLKLVVDFDTLVYDHVLYDNTEYDGASKPVIGQALSNVPALEFYFWVNTQTGNQGIVYVDTHVLTVNEP